MFPLLFMLFDYIICLRVYKETIKPEIFSLVLERKNSYRLNSVDDNILMSECSPAIFRIGASLIFKYHVDHCGLIWKFSKKAYILDEMFNSLLIQKREEIFKKCEK